MAPNGSRKGQAKATARAIIQTLDIHRPLSLDWDRIKGFISERIRILKLIYNVCGIKDESASGPFYDINILDPVTTRHFSQFQLMWPHRRSRS